MCQRKITQMKRGGGGEGEGRTFTNYMWNLWRANSKVINFSIWILALEITMLEQRGGVRSEKRRWRKRWWVSHPATQAAMEEEGKKDIQNKERGPSNPLGRASEARLTTGNGEQPAASSSDFQSFCKKFFWERTLVPQPTFTGILHTRHPAAAMTNRTLTSPIPRGAIAITTALPLPRGVTTEGVAPPAPWAVTSWTFGPLAPGGVITGGFALPAP